MMFTPFFSSRMTRRPALAGATRLEVCPPALFNEPEPAWKRLVHWLRSPAPLEASAGQDRLTAVQQEFTQSLVDIGTRSAFDLRERMRHARSLRELWHLRPELFDLIARHHNQPEAARRLAQLNRHFPTRAPRSGFAPLEH